MTNLDLYRIHSFSHPGRLPKSFWVGAYYNFDLRIGRHVKTLENPTTSRFFPWNFREKINENNLEVLNIVKPLLLGTRYIYARCVMDTIFNRTA